MENSTIIYTTATEARNEGYLDAWRDSLQENMKVREIIDTLIDMGFDGWTLDKHIIEDIQDVMRMHGLPFERARLVLAATVTDRDHDGRFSKAARAWAAGIMLPAVDSHSLFGRSQYCLRSHSAIINGLVEKLARAEK